MTTLRSVVTVVLILSYCLGVVAIKQNVDMVADVIRAMELNRPTSVIAALCWPPNKKADLVRALLSEDMQVSVRFVRVQSVAERHHPDQHVVFLADATCNEIDTYFRRNSAATHFRSPFRWLIVGEPNDKGVTVSHVPESLLKIDILPDSQVMIATRTGEQSFSLNQIYRRSIQGSWIVEYIASWSSEQGVVIDIAARQPLAIRRLNLEGTVITVCYVLTNNDTINHLTDYKDDHIDTITKVNFPLTNHLLDFMHAGRKYYYAETWGYPVNGSWSGMIGYMTRGEVELGGTPMFFTLDRVSTVDFISSPTPTLSKFVFRQPKLSYENNLFLLPFRASVWYCSIALFFLFLFVLFFTTFWEWRNPCHLKPERITDSGILRPSLADVTLFTIGAACQQGSPVELKGSLGRVVMIVVFMALMFLYTSYSANIVALLQSSSSHVRSLEDLLHSRLKFGVDDTVFNHYYFSTATEPTRKAIYQTKVAPPGVKPKFMSLEEGVKNMRKGLFAFHMETGVGYKFVGKFFHEDEKCGLKEIQYLQVFDPWLGVRKNTPYKEMFKIGMRRIQEFGLQNRENNLLYAKKPQCTSRGSSFISVSMVDCYPALLVLSFGTIVSAFILIIERLAFKRAMIIKKLSCNSCTSPIAEFTS